jgi:hypothetical protein
MDEIFYECDECEVRGWGSECWLDPAHPIRNISKYVIQHSFNAGAEVSDIIGHEATDDTPPIY